MTNIPTIAAPPTTTDVASEALAVMAALSGVLTDYNAGSQVRTMVQAQGSIIEQQGVWTQAYAFQASIYGAMSAYNVTPYPAFSAAGVASFATSASTPPVANQNISIPSGTVVQTTGGVQFATTSGVVLASGTSTVMAPIQAVIAGQNGNVVAGAITQIVTGLLYPLFVTNAAPTQGGTAPEPISQTLARFASQVSSVGLASPGAIANAAIGVTYNPTGEVVLYSTCFEPWLAAGAGPGSGVAGWQLYIDNGRGAASSGLINAVIAKLNGAGGNVGYRDAGVPYGVFAVTPTWAIVGISGTVSSLTTSAAVSGIINTAVSGYFNTLAFGASGEQALLATSVGNATLGLMTSLIVQLYASGSPTPLTVLSCPSSGRVVLNQINLSLT